MDILHGIETKALALRQLPPTGDITSIAEQAASIELPMERPLHSPAFKPRIANIVLSTEDNEVDASALYEQVMVDTPRLSRHIRQALQTRSQITLSELIATQPLQLGLAELVAYLQLGSESFKTVVDEKAEDMIAWAVEAPEGAVLEKRARLPRVIFVR